MFCAAAPAPVPSIPFFMEIQMTIAKSYAYVFCFTSTSSDIFSVIYLCRMLILLPK